MRFLSSLQSTQTQPPPSYNRVTTVRFHPASTTSSTTVGCTSSALHRQFSGSSLKQWCLLFFKDLDIKNKEEKISTPKTKKKNSGLQTTFPKNKSGVP
jgi:hypothetical protein